jgi:pimeloyl-ACP methyl ester carboxylesterase
MPRLGAGDVTLHWEIQGEGHPLVLIRGFASNADHWYCQLPELSARFRVLVFDNRGVGRSDRPQGPCTIPMMADDTVGLMDALGIPRAHVLGISMGGMIAQEMALRHPRRVMGLVLACTHCGGSRFVPPSVQVGQLLADYAATGSPEAAARAAACLFTPTTLRNAPEIVERYTEVSRRFPVETGVLLRQYDAIRGHDAWGRLPRIQAPTLVITGDEDVLIPPENSRILAERIPGAVLRVIPGGGHQFMLEQAQAFNQAVVEFLEGLPQGDSRACSPRP